MKYHFIGIGGVGMSALARIMREKGHEVSGSDVAKSYVTKDLEEIGIDIFYEQVKENITKDQIVVYSTAIKPSNPEWIAARENVKMHRSELLEELLAEKNALLVVGAHGKTTTTSLLSHIFETASFDPSFVIGGFSDSLHLANGRCGKGDYFIAEGDESDGSFLRANPFGAIITNVDFDHLDFWKSEDALLEAYQKFIKQVKRKELLFYFHEDHFLTLWKTEGISYGFDENADLRASNIRFSKGRQFFTIGFQGKTFDDVQLNLLGRHNVLNAIACFGMAYSLGIQEEKIRLALATFKGVKRRLEWKGNVNGADIYDDYAHHPEEIEATLAALRQAFKDLRRIAVFQPHRYTRLKDLMAQFANAKVWKDSDELIVTDIFSAGEDKIEGVTIEVFLKQLEKKFTYVPRDKLTDFLRKKIQANDLVVTLGAGDITKVSAELTT
jgi:UDP-N-acetylmuramate--alanine ligase